MKDLSRQYDYLTIEGSGGIICPLVADGTHSLFLTDVMKLLAVPLIIVAPSGLGTINSTLLTLDYARSHDLTVGGIILNNWRGGVMEEDNAAMIEQYGQVSILAKIKQGQQDFPIAAAEITTWYKEVLHHDRLAEGR